MRVNLQVLVGSVVVVLLVGIPAGIGQPPPGQGKDFKVKGAPPPPGQGNDLKIKGAPGPLDEEREILREIKEAYKAPFEVHQDVLKELRRSYQQPSADREAKILREIRRLYQPTAAQEMAILGQIRQAYIQPSTEQEERVFREIDRADPLPPGAVPPSVQTEQAGKIFRKLDLNGDGVLSADEMTAALRAERDRWDINRDGFIDQNEYWAYYQGHLQSLSARVASGEIDLGLSKGKPPPVIPSVPTEPEEPPRPIVYRAGKLPAGLPDWFVKLDTDGDGQIGLYEWKKSGRPIEEFLRMDLNDDGFITIDELTRYLAQQSGNQPADQTHTGMKTVSKKEKR